MIDIAALRIMLERFSPARDFSTPSSDVKRQLEQT
jgi:hypothetical protein